MDLMFFKYGEAHPLPDRRLIRDMQPASFAQEQEPKTFYVRTHIWANDGDGIDQYNCFKVQLVSSDGPQWPVFITEEVGTIPVIQTTH